jgi:hypothetical protein
VKELVTLLVVPPSFLSEPTTAKEAFLPVSENGLRALLSTIENCIYDPPGGYKYLLTPDLSVASSLLRHLKKIKMEF